ncbi:MAG: hypothetical protein ACPL6D_14125, partial [Thermodesulfobacteriota bacterium]
MNILRNYPKKLLWRLYWISLVLTLLIDLLWLYTKKFHYHFPFQYLPEFFALFGFFGCMALIFVAKGMGFFIVKEEDYYEKRLRR